MLKFLRQWFHYCNMKIVEQKRVTINPLEARTFHDYSSLYGQLIKRQCDTCGHFEYKLTTPKDSYWLDEDSYMFWFNKQGQW
jgi:hypothetical protein